MYGKQPVNEQIALNCVAAVVNGNTGGYTDNNKSKDFMGRIGVSLPMGLSLGGSAYIGKTPKEGVEDDVTKNRFGGDLKLSTGPILVQAEGLLGKNDETNAMGFYALASYKRMTLLPSFEPVSTVLSPAITSCSFSINWVAYHSDF